MTSAHWIFWFHRRNQSEKQPQDNKQLISSRWETETTFYEELDREIDLNNPSHIVKEMKFRAIALQSATSNAIIKYRWSYLYPLTMTWAKKSSLPLRKPEGMLSIEKHIEVLTGGSKEAQVIIILQHRHHPIMLIQTNSLSNSFLLSNLAQDSGIHRMMNLQIYLDTWHWVS